jgi:hypothetical protein
LVSGVGCVVSLSPKGRKRARQQWKGANAGREGEEEKSVGEEEAKLFSLSRVSAPSVVFTALSTLQKRNGSLEAGERVPPRVDRGEEEREESKGVRERERERESEAGNASRRSSEAAEK